MTSMLVTLVPVKQHAYRVNALKRSVMKTEVEYLLENGLAKPSCRSVEFSMFACNYE